MQEQKDPEEMEDGELTKEIGRIETRLYFLRERKEELFSNLNGRR